jgi:catechol 2,3-dioxygenase-like lactoylglutathione lyase family enzyme
VSTDPTALPAFEVAFETDDVAAALDRALQAGAKLVQEVETMDWGQITAYVSTPDGTMVEICTAVG